MQAAAGCGELHRNAVPCAGVLPCCRNGALASIQLYCPFVSLLAFAPGVFVDSVIGFFFDFDIG